MSLFLTTFLRSFECKFILTICPFIVNTKKSRVSCTTSSNMYTILHMLVIGTGFLYCIIGVSSTFRLPGYTTTRTMNELFTHFVIFSVFLSCSVLSFTTRKQHADIIGSISSIFDTTFCEYPSTHNYTRLHVANLVYILWYFIFPFTILLLLTFVQWENAIAMILYLVICCYISAYMLLILVHIQDLVIVICDISDTYCNRLSAELVPNPLASDAVGVYDQLCDLMVNINGCFGVHLMLIAVHDVMLITNMLMFLIQILIWENGVWLRFQGILVYLIPVIVKNVVQFNILGRLDSTIYELHLALMNRISKLEPFEFEDNINSGNVVI